MDIDVSKLNINHKMDDREVFLIAQAQDQRENFVQEEQNFCTLFEIVHVDFATDGCGVYKYQTDAIRVAKALIAAKGTRKLAVICAIK